MRSHTKAHLRASRTRSLFLFCASGFVLDGEPHKPNITHHDDKSFADDAGTQSYCDCLYTVNCYLTHIERLRAHCRGARTAASCDRATRATRLARSLHQVATDLYHCARLYALQICVWCDRPNGINKMTYRFVRSLFHGILTGWRWLTLTGERTVMILSTLAIVCITSYIRLQYNACVLDV